MALGYTEGQTITVAAASALAANRRVRLGSSGTLEYCSDSSTDCIGETVAPVLAAGDLAAVRVAHGDGMHLFSAADAISKGAACYAAANGQVQASGTVLVGEAMEASENANDVIGVLPSPAAILGAIARTGLTQQDLQPYTIPITAWKVWDAMTTQADAGANDDLGVITGTLGAALPVLQTGDVKAGNTVTRYAAVEFPLPVEYVAGQTVTFRALAGMVTTVAGTSAVVDLNAYCSDDATADICTTAAQSINNLTAANKDFTITPTNLAAGDNILLRVGITTVDAATGTAVIGEISKTQMLLDIKG